MLLHQLKPPVCKGKKKLDPNFIDPQTIEHDILTTNIQDDLVICYTDGSASPNPGPCGAGASVFIAATATVVDIGASLGFGSNNYAELYALGMLFIELANTCTSDPSISTAFIFCDSNLAINAATSKKIPLTNVPITRFLRLALEALNGVIKVGLKWIRGHSRIGGNERVDRISKRYA